MKEGHNLKLLEYQAKELFGKYGLTVKKGCVVDELATITEKIKAAGLQYPVVIKAQVQIGGRGKAGGVQFADSEAEAVARAQELLFKDIRGLTAKELLIVEKAEITREWYLSILLDRGSKSPMIIFSAKGGMEIEDTAKTHPEAIAKVTVNPFLGIKDYHIDYLLDVTGADKSCKKQLAATVQKLYQLFTDYNALLVEINPLATDEAGQLIALDGKIDIDDSALFKLPDIVAYRDHLQEDAMVLEARKFNFLYIPVDEQGDIAVMSNGSGLLMSCIDLLAKKGMAVSSALDLGGGATADRIKEAVRILLNSGRVHTLLICIFGGITRCDEVVEGVRLALAEQAEKKTVVIRMEGTNKECAMQIVESVSDQVTTARSIPDAVEILAKKREA